MGELRVGSEIGTTTSPLRAPSTSFSSSFLRSVRDAEGACFGGEVELGSAPPTTPDAPFNDSVLIHADGTASILSVATAVDVVGAGFDKVARGSAAVATGLIRLEEE